MTKVCLIVLLAASVLSCATTNLPTDNIDELEGEWVNPAFNPRGGSSIYRGKVIWRADGIYEIYPSVDSTTPQFELKWTLVRKWKTKDGVIFFEIISDADDRAYHTFTHEDGQLTERKALLRLSADKTTYEQIANFSRLEGDEATFPTPEEINVMRDFYLVYYRD